MRTPLVRGIALSGAAAIVGIVATVAPPAELPDHAAAFWTFLIYVWFGLAAILAITYTITVSSRLGINLPLALALLIGGAASPTTAILAHRAAGPAPALAAGSWLLFFLIIGGIELAQRPQRTHL